jgi:hypothetical protein
MFARNVSIQLRPNMLPDCTRIFENDVLPLLRKQNGFRDEITFSNPAGTEVTTISLWDNKATADVYNTSTYPEVLKTLAKVIDGMPKVKSGEVVSSTFHKITAAVAA